MKKILVSLDLNNVYEPLVEQGSQLAKAFSAELILATIPEGNADASAKLQAITTELTEAGVNATAELLDGEPGMAVVAKAQAINADAIVIGTRGNSSVFDTLAGSAGQDIMQHAKRPVLLVPVPKD